MLKLPLIKLKGLIAFDLNKYQQDRRERLKQKARNNCVHLQVISIDNDGREAASFWVSPPGTSWFICERCSAKSISITKEEVERDLRYYTLNPREYLKAEKKFWKIVRKAGLM